MSTLPAFAVGRSPEPLNWPTPRFAPEERARAFSRMDPASLRRLQDVGLIALFAALSFVVLFWRLGVPSFWDPDEAHYAQTTREMLATGDWWAPFYNEQPFFDKPVLFHQLQGLAMLLLGPTELAARIVPATAAFILVLVPYWFGRSVG